MTLRPDKTHYWLFRPGQTNNKFGPNPKTWHQSSAGTKQQLPNMRKSTNRKSGRNR